MSLEATLLTNPVIPPRVFNRLAQELAADPVLRALDRKIWGGPRPSAEDPRLIVTPNHRIDSKKQFYNLSQRQLLGNTIRQWEVEEYFDCGFQGGVGVRHKVPGSKLMKYDLSREAALAYINELAGQGIPITDLQVSELAPDHRITLQGEVMRDENGLRLISHLFSGTRMRYALAGGYIDRNGKLRYDRRRVKDDAGLKATLKLRHWMDAASWDCLQDLFDLYPDSVIEFACYQMKLGVLGWNTVIWEVRNF